MQRAVNVYTVYMYMCKLIYTKLGPCGGVLVVSLTKKLLGEQSMPTYNIVVSMTLAVTIYFIH